MKAEQSLFRLAFRYPRYSRLAVLPLALRNLCWLIFFFFFGVLPCGFSNKRETVCSLFEIASGEASSIERVLLSTLIALSNKCSQVAPYL